MLNGKTTSSYLVLSTYVISSPLLYIGQAFGRVWLPCRGYTTFFGLQHGGNSNGQRWENQSSGSEASPSSCSRQPLQQYQSSLAGNQWFALVLAQLCLWQISYNFRSCPLPILKWDYFLCSWRDWLQWWSFEICLFGTAQWIFALYLKVCKEIVKCRAKLLSK